MRPADPGEYLRLVRECRERVERELAYIAQQESVARARRAAEQIIQDKANEIFRQSVRVTAASKEAFDIEVRVIERQEREWWDSWLKEKIEEWKAARSRIEKIEAENKEWKRTRERRAREQIAYEQKLLGTPTGTVRRLEERIRELSGFTGVGNKGVRLHPEELHGGPIGYRVCGSAQWENVIKAMEEV